jgi:uncharacterized membrane protein YgdD (TMEM256/DUF423 family)
MIRAWLAVAALGGFLSVAGGAAAAHLAAGDAHVAQLLRTGAIYGMTHAAALVGIAAIAGRSEHASFLWSIAGWNFAAGICLFSFSLFALALTGARWFALVTPFGGTALLVGWAALGLGALSRR